MKRFKKMSFAMFSSAGDKAVERVLNQVLNRLTERNSLPLDLEFYKINCIVKQIEDLVEEMGLSQINPSKYDESDYVEGFEEVHDYVVQDNIYIKIQDFIIEYNRKIRK